MHRKVCSRIWVIGLVHRPFFLIWIRLLLLFRCFTKAKRTNAAVLLLVLLGNHYCAVYSLSAVQHAFHTFFSGIVALQFKETTERFEVFRWWMAGDVLRPFNSNKMCTLRLHTQTEKKPHCFVYYLHIIIINNNKRSRQASERNEQLWRWIEQRVRWLQGIPLE